MLVTPVLAEVLLKGNKLNRPVSEKNIIFLSNQMRAGTFKRDTGESIKVSKTGNLLDGQHRLLAIIRANIAQQMLVVSELDDDIFSVLDTGKKRNASDVLSINGYKSTVGLSGMVRAIKILNSITVNFKQQNAITNSEILEFVKDNEEISEIYSFCENYYRKFRSIPPNNLAAIYFILVKKGYLPEKIEEFMNLYSTGLSLKDDNPIYVLRNKLIIDSQSKSKLSVKNKIALFIHTWNLWTRNKNCTKMSVPENFPKII